MVLPALKFRQPGTFVGGSMWKTRLTQWRAIDLPTAERRVLDKSTSIPGWGITGKVFTMQP